MLKVYGQYRSRAFRVVWLCKEANIPYEHVNTTINVEGATCKAPEYVKLNPNARVPTIDDDGFVLWESQPIVRYLARKHSLGFLCPTDAQACADADRWMDWNATTVWPNLRPVFWNLVRTEPAKRDMPLVATSLKGLAASMTLLDSHLATRPYVAGSTFTMGDIPVGVSIQRWFRMDIERENLPNLAAYYKRLQERPAYVKYADLPLT